VTQDQIGYDIASIIEAAEEIRDPLDDLVERAKNDPGAPFEDEAIASLKSAARSRPADFERIWARLKTETKVRCARLEETMKPRDRRGSGCDRRSPWTSDYVRRNRPLA
jgi:hypothetical protein